MHPIPIPRALDSSSRENIWKDKSYHRGKDYSESGKLLNIGSTLIPSLLLGIYLTSRGICIIVSLYVNLQPTFKKVKNQKMTALGGNVIPK